ncbi:hypothetical protein T8S45_13140 [Blastomonas marina]|uniref:hypothetical protein n=1 Tax=Blastomonas marina TaxID=1867408 RepID=UPI002AC8F563|nr:hypothetical protein [Blastomonas marina]WPZ03761.1 hypothetical protein T8S45_13140 [Blastomonas marina]
MKEPQRPAQLRLDDAIDRQGPELAAIGREAITAATAAMPTANRIVDDSDGLLRVHFAPGVDLAATIVTVSFHAFWVSYDFPRGDRMYDLDELLRGTLGSMRHYVIEGAGDVRDTEVELLLRDAIDRADPPPNSENRAILCFRSELEAER